MEGTNRNSARTNNRNEGALKTLDKKIPFEPHGFFYQYCNNNKCRQITVLLKPLPRLATEREVEAFTHVIEQSATPGVILQYPDPDVIIAIKIAPDGTQETKESQWGPFLKYLHTLQVAHEQDSGMSECANYKHEPLPAGKWKSTEEDVVFSNHARTVPGVRHIDTDGAYHCTDCLDVLFLVEASSDGCPGTPMENKYKATTMTRKVAEHLGAIPLLIQHHYGDEEHQQPCYLTSWKNGSQKRYARTWDRLVEDFENYRERHSAECSSGH